MLLGIESWEKKSACEPVSACWRYFAFICRGAVRTCADAYHFHTIVKIGGEEGFQVVVGAGSDRPRTALKAIISQSRESIAEKGSRRLERNWGNEGCLGGE
jgi:hypothetical protein